MAEPSSRRKPLDEACDGGVFCPVYGHVRTRWFGPRARISHVPLTVGQQKTLRARRAVSRG